MGLNQRVSARRIAVLGAANGLLFGVIAEMLRERYVQLEIQRIIEEYGRNDTLQFQMVDPMRWYFIPMMSITLFTVSSHLLYRFWKGRLKSILLFWEAVAFLSATGFTLLYLINGPVINSQHLLDTLRFWLICFGMAISVNSIYGIFIKLSSTKLFRHTPYSYTIRPRR